jgi:hypothetical protein
MKQQRNVRRRLIMHRCLSRRTFLLAGSAIVAPRVSFAASPAPSPVPAPAEGGPNASFPSHDPDLVREMVGAAHARFDRVKELVEARPKMALAEWDWGFGDWESALGAASHVGNREIAGYLISKGARPTLFSATMLGQLDVVKAFVAASPGVQRIHGPHGITLLAHAKAGGEQAKPVLSYLEQLGDADPRIASPALTDAEAAALVGTYVFGPGPNDRIIIDAAKGQLGFLRANATKRGLAQRGPLEFSPVGAPDARIKFVVADGLPTTLTVHDPDIVVTARRVTD